MRTGVITYDFYPLIGGIGRHTLQMYSRLEGCDLLYFSPADNHLPRHIRIISPLINRFRQAGVSLWLHWNARRIITEHHLDQLNIHTGPGGVLCISRLPVPVIITCHHTYHQQCRHLPSQFWKRLFIPFESMTYRRASRIIAVSEATKAALIEHYRIPAAKITVIHNAVDTGRFHPLGIPKQPHSILYLGRIDKRKGIDFLIRSMPLVREQIPDVQLAVCGTGACLEKMKRLVSRLGLQQNVTFYGFVPDEELNERYNLAQCVVVPSVFEGFGITVIEALAAGTRVVGTDSDGIREILQGGDYGRLVPYGDTHALAKAIAGELRSPQSPRPLREEYVGDAFRRRYREVLGM